MPRLSEGLTAVNGGSCGAKDTRSGSGGVTVTVCVVGVGQTVHQLYARSSTNRASQSAAVSRVLAMFGTIWWFLTTLLLSILLCYVFPLPATANTQIFRR